MVDSTVSVFVGVPVTHLSYQVHDGLLGHLAQNNPLITLNVHLKQSHKWYSIR